MANVRQSTVGSSDICAQRIVYDLDPNVPYGSGIARALGTAAHAGLERGTPGLAAAHLRAARRSGSRVARGQRRVQA